MNSNNIKKTVSNLLEKNRKELMQYLSSLKEKDGLLDEKT